MSIEYGQSPVGPSLAGNQSQTKPETIELKALDEIVKDPPGVLLTFESCEGRNWASSLTGRRSAI